MMRVDHLAIEAENLAETANWYVRHLQAQVLYRDESWAFLKLGQLKLALVKPGDHPPHLAFAVSAQQLDELSAQHNQPVQPHRDGTRGIYVKDPAGNAVEFITYPTGDNH